MLLLRYHAAEASTSHLSLGRGLVLASCTIVHVCVTKKLLAQLENTALQPSRAVLLRSLQFKMKMADFIFFPSLACYSRLGFEWELWVV